MPGAGWSRISKDGLSYKREGINFRMIMHGQRDLVRSWLGLSPHKIPIVGKPGSIALMTRKSKVSTRADTMIMIMRLVMSFEVF